MQKISLIAITGTNTKSISDDDLCADCENCLYVVGKESGCLRVSGTASPWPATFDEDGCSTVCNQFIPVKSSGSNWIEGV